MNATTQANATAHTCAGWRQTDATDAGAWVDAVIGSVLRR